MGCGVWSAILMIVVGAWIWASNYGIIVFSFYRDWPIILVLIGVYVFVKLRRRRRWHKK